MVGTTLVYAEGYKVSLRPKISLSLCNGIIAFNPTASDIRPKLLYHPYYGEFDCEK